MGRRILTVVLFLAIFLTVTPAQARVTGQVCNTYTPNNFSETICIGVDAQHVSLADGDKVHGFMSGSGNATKVDVTFIDLWHVTSGCCPGSNWNRVAHNGNAGSFTAPFVWTTAWVKNNNCGGAGVNDAFHATGSFRIHWPDGDVGPWRTFDSNDAFCLD